MSFEFLFRPLDDLDGWVSGMFAGAPLLVSLGLAFALGLRHASDPDHLVAVTSLVADDDGDSRGAVRLGAWWGLGHAVTLLALGLPLIALKADLPGWLETAAEKAVGFVIILLAARVTWKWARGHYRAGPHRHQHGDGGVAGGAHRHLRRGDGHDHGHAHVRTPTQAFAIGLLHGLAGTGAVVVLLIAALPTQLEAAAALSSGSGTRASPDPGGQAMPHFGRPPARARGRASPASLGGRLGCVFIDHGWGPIVP